MLVRPLRVASSIQPSRQAKHHVDAPFAASLKGGVLTSTLSHLAPEDPRKVRRISPADRVGTTWHAQTAKCVSRAAPCSAIKHQGCVDPAPSTAASRVAKHSSIDVASTHAQRPAADKHGMLRCCGYTLVSYRILGRRTTCYNQQKISRKQFRRLHHAHSPKQGRRKVSCAELSGSLGPRLCTPPLPRPARERIGSFRVASSSIVLTWIRRICRAVRARRCCSVASGVGLVGT
jgi:hypothetical protein